MTQETEQFIRAIHASTARMVVAITGGGVSALAQMLAVPGGSKTVLDARVPYSEQALADWLGATPEQACSERTARAMAMAAYTRAVALEGSAAEAVGIGATASLATDRAKRGEHRIHAAYQTESTTGTVSLVMNKGDRTRPQEEQLAADVLLHTIAEAAGVAQRPELTLRTPEELSHHQVQGPAEWQQLLIGDREYVGVNYHCTDHPIALYPGAFNPLHQGHREIFKLAERLLERPVVYELSIANVEKPPLDFMEIQSRTAQLEDQPMLLTRAATFLEKSRLFTKTPFVVGADTMARIGEAKYYANSESQREAAIAELKELGASFLVFGREIAGKYHTLDSLDVPKSLLELATAVPESVFRQDVSSTELRNGN